MSLLPAQLAPPPADWRIWIVPVALLLGFGGYYAGIWFFRMRLRGRRMEVVARELGGTFRSGLDQRATDATPQLQGTQLRLAQSAYNTVTLAWNLLGKECRVWMGDAGTQFLRDPLVSAVGGDHVSGFIAVESPLPLVRNAFIIDLAYRADQRRGRLQARGSGGAIENIAESFRDRITHAGLVRVRTGRPEFDSEFGVWADCLPAAQAVLNRSTIDMLMGGRPGHLWIKDGVVFLHGGSGAWSAELFLDAAEWLREFLLSWDLTDAQPLELSIKERRAPLST